jgi:hypothetical protein
LHGFTTMLLTSWYTNRLKSATVSIPELLNVSAFYPVQDRICKPYNHLIQPIDPDQLELENLIRGEKLNHSYTGIIFKFQGPAQFVSCRPSLLF